MFPDEESAKSTLKPFEDRIIKVVQDAWGECWGKYKDLHDYKRTRATIMHQLMVRHANIVFAGESKVRIIPGQETAYFLIEDHLAIRLKKGDEKHLGQNNETQMSLAFTTPGSDQASLPLGLPDVNRIDITYRLNDLESKIKDVGVAGRNGSKRLWYFDIYPRMGEAGSIVEFPSASTPPPGPESVLSVPDAAMPDKKHG